MSNISFMYRNLCESPRSITETFGTTNSIYGTSMLADGNLQSYWSTDRISNSTILFDFGSSVSIDSLIVIHNMNIGTLFIGAGGTIASYGTSDVFYGLPLYGSTGTSVNFLTTPVNFRYWKLFANGTNLNEVTKIKEVFLGRRITPNINPEYPFQHELDSATIVTESEKGQKKVYHKYSRNKWNFKYSAIDDALWGTMRKIRSYCSGSYRPFFMCIDSDDNKFETYFCRFGKNSFQHQEISYGLHDVVFSVEEEL